MARCARGVEVGRVCGAGGDHRWRRHVYPCGSQGSGVAAGGVGPRHCLADCVGAQGIPKPAAAGISGSRRRWCTRCRTPWRCSAAVVVRHRTAVSERRVTTRPAPDSMAYLSVLMPVEQAVCVQATLGRDADSLIATGNSGGRTRGNCPAAGGRGRRQWHRDVVAARVFVPAVGCVDGDGVAVAHVPEGPATADRPAGSDVQDSVVRCADPASRPHPLTPRIRCHDGGQRVRPLRGMQPREGRRRMVRPPRTQPRPHPPHRPRHPDRAPLPVGGPTAPGPGTALGSRGGESEHPHRAVRSVLVDA